MQARRKLGELELFAASLNAPRDRLKDPGFAVLRPMVTASSEPPAVEKIVTAADEPTLLAKIPV